MIKKIGNYILGAIIFLCILAIPAFFIYGGVWLGKIILPWLFWLSIITLIILVLIILPLSIFKNTRSFSSFCMFIGSYIFGVTVWFSGLLLTYMLWGGFAVFIGLCLVGVGVVPIAMLATLFKGQWLFLGYLIIFTILTFGSRMFGLFLEKQ